MSPKAALSAAHIKCAGQKYNKKTVMQANSKIVQFTNSSFRAY
jgi:HKD family nuclease